MLFRGNVGEEEMFSLVYKVGIEVDNVGLSIIWYLVELRDS